MLIFITNGPPAKFPVGVSISIIMRHDIIAKNNLVFLPVKIALFPNFMPSICISNMVDWTLI